MPFATRQQVATSLLTVFHFYFTRVVVSRPDILLVYVNNFM